MASINVAKFTTAGARGLAVHFDDKKRLELEHANPHIDKTRTQYNYWIGCDSYKEVLYNMTERQRELDTLKPPKRIRADRVTMCSVEIPVPEWLTADGQTDDFLERAYDVLKREFGSANVHGMTVHADEQHEYLDPDDHQRKISLVHGHAFITPEDAEKGLNAKACITREKLRDLNTSINDMCLEVYGREYQTHKCSKSLTVEQLKVDTLQAEIKEAERKIQLLQDTIKHREQVILRQKDILHSVQNELHELHVEREELEEHAIKLRNVIAKAEKLDIAKEYSLKAEIDRLSKEVKRLNDLCVKHEIDPSERVKKHTRTYDYEIER